MEGRQAELLKKVWEDRFTGNTLKAILVENNKEVTDVYDNLCAKLQSLGIEEVNNKIILAVFLDFTDVHEATLAADMDNLEVEIENVLSQNIFEFLIFDYVGAYRREFREATIRRALRNQIQRSIYNNKRTFLVGRNPLSNEEESWKGEMALLDVVSRGEGQAIAHFLTGTFGFLRYRDSNQDKRNEYIRRIAQLKRLLSDHGEDELRNNLEKYMEEHLKQPIAEVCNPVSGIYPVPVGLLSRPAFGIFGSTKEFYEDCVSKTLAALNETAKTIEDYMQALCRELIADAGDILNRLMEESDVGIELMQDMQAGRRIFNQDQRSIGDVRISLYGKYKLEELQQEIDKFLNNMYEQALCSVREDFITAIGAAWESIPLNKIEELKQKYEEELTLLTERLKTLPEVNNFCSEVLANQHFDSTFHPINANLSSQESKSLLFSGHEIYREVEKSGYPNTIQPFYYGLHSGYESVEALSTFMYQNVNTQMEDILKELIVIKEENDGI